MNKSTADKIARMFSAGSTKKQISSKLDVTASQIDSVIKARNLKIGRVFLKEDLTPEDPEFSKVRIKVNENTWIALDCNMSKIDMRNYIEHWADLYKNSVEVNFDIVDRSLYQIHKS